VRRRFLFQALILSSVSNAGCRRGPGVGLQVTPPLTTVEEVAFNADVTRFNGLGSQDQYAGIHGIGNTFLGGAAGPGLD
jgi:hypothetical protein